MGTPFSVVIDRALIIIRDYGLDNLYENDPDGFVQVMTNYMLQNLYRFTECFTSLEYEIESASFLNSLSPQEIGIIAEWTVIAWYESNLNDVLEFKETLQDKEFKKYSTGQNLIPRQDYLRDLYTRVKLDSSNYAWGQWNKLDFFGGQ